MVPPPKPPSRELAVARPRRCRPRSRAGLFAPSCPADGGDGDAAAAADAVDSDDEGHGHRALRRRCTCCALALSSSNNVSTGVEGIRLTYAVPGSGSEWYPMRRTPIRAVVEAFTAWPLIVARKPAHHAARLQG